MATRTPKNPLRALADADHRPKAAASTEPQAASPGDHPLPPGGHRQSAIERVPATTPLVYADQVSDVVYGVHTSKLVLSIETGSGSVRPQAIVTLPTSALLFFARSVVRDLSAPAIIDETLERFGTVIDMMRASAKRSTSSGDADGT